MKEIEELIDGMEEELKEIRRYFHSHPELSNQEFATADRICEYLDRWGVEYERGIAETGIVAMVRGKKTGKTVGIRADMDALPVEEENDVPYRSEQPGVLHACGHDAHMTVLLGGGEGIPDHEGPAVRKCEILLSAGGGDHRRSSADDPGGLSGKSPCGLCAGASCVQPLRGGQRRRP